MPAKKKVEAPKLTLSSLTPKSYRHEILHPATFDRTGGWVQLVGQYSPEFDKASRAVKKSKATDLESMEDLSVEALSSCIIDWDVDFFEQEFSHENALAMLKNPIYGWIKVGIEDAVITAKNFF